jgi:hypothetical protein
MLLQTIAVNMVVTRMFFFKVLSCEGVNGSRT